jgi:hypothetical protein
MSFRELVTKNGVHNVLQRIKRSSAFFQQHLPPVTIKSYAQAIIVFFNHRM